MWMRGGDHVLDKSALYMVVALAGYALAGPAYKKCRGAAPLLPRATTRVPASPHYLPCPYNDYAPQTRPLHGHCKGGCACAEGTTCWINPHSTWWSPWPGTHSLALYVHHLALIVIDSASYLYSAGFHSHIHGSIHVLS